MELPSDLTLEELELQLLRERREAERRVNHVIERTKQLELRLLREEAKKDDGTHQ